MSKLFIILILILSNCEHSVKTYPEISFAHLPSIILKARKFDLAYEYQPSFRDPNVEHLLPVNLEQVVKNWVDGRIKISGDGEKALKVIIKNASVIRSNVNDSNKKLKSLLTSEAEEIYKANLEIVFEFYSSDNIFPTHSMTITANCFKSVPEGAILNERNEMFYQITKQLMIAINSEFDKNVENYLGEFITYNL